MGPTLLIIWINDIRFNIACKSIIYADDTSLFVSHKVSAPLEAISALVFGDKNEWFYSKWIVSEWK